MPLRTTLLLLLAIVACGCSRSKSTEELLADLKSPRDQVRVAAVRQLPQRERNPAAVVPVLIETLKDNSPEVRWSAVIGLGSFGEQAKDAIPVLQPLQQDRDPRVRQASAVALSRIDPERFPKPPKRP